MRRLVARGGYPPPALWALARASFHRYASYRAAAIAGASTNSVFGMVRVAVLTGAIATAAAPAASAVATTTAATTVAGYTAAQAATYAWVNQGLITPIHVFIWNDLAQRVRNGDLAVACPPRRSPARLARRRPRPGLHPAPPGLPPVLIGALTTGLLLPRTTPCHTCSA